MTPAELRDAIIALAQDIAKRSTSPTVDQWAAELEVLAGTIPTLAPTIIERRQPNSDRRVKDDPTMQQFRRSGSRRRGPPKPTAPAPTTMTISSPTSGTARLVDDTEQFTAEVTARRNDPMGNYTDVVLSVLPESWVSSDTNVATIVSGTGVATYVGAGSVTFTASYQGLTATVSRTVTAAVASLTSISISPATTSVQTGATRQFTVTEHYDNGTSVVASSGVTFSVVSGSGSVTGTSTGTYTAPGSAGSATVRASKSGFTADAAVTITASSGLTYEYFDDFTGYGDLAALRTASEATASPDWNFTTPVGYTNNHWAATSLVNDSILGRQVVRTPFLAQTNYYINTPTTVNGTSYPHTATPGDTTRVYVTPAAPMSFIWARMLFRWPQHTRLKENNGQNPPGYTGTMDADLGNGQDQSFGGAALKLMFFQWAAGHPDRQDIVYNNGYKMVAGITQLNNAATETQFEGSSVLESGGASLVTGDWYSLTMMSRIMSATVGRYGFWFQRLSVSGTYNPQPASFYLLTRTWAVAARQVRQVQFGVNKNHGNGVTRYRDLAELSIIDGNDHENPWNLPGTLVGS